MRALESFLARRKISDFKLWCSNNGISSMAALVSFCKNQELALNEEKYSSFFGDIPKKTDQEKGTAPNWHTPAADRPVTKRRTSKRANTRRNKSVKEKKEE